MKKSIVTLAILATLSSCTPQESDTKKPETHKASILFELNSSSNISSINIYRDDRLIGQMPATDAENSTYSFDDDKTIADQSYTLRYTVEPLFMDSTNANVNIEMELKIDDSTVVAQNIAGIKYGEVAELEYTKE